MMKTLSVIIFALAVFCAKAETGRQFFAWQKDMGQEKLFLTIDRPYYEAGDTVWFRGTLVSAESLSYIVKTNYIYVELLNRADQVVLRRKVLREGLCFAHCLPLAPGLASGEYTLRAYTSWMRNFDNAFFFSRKLTIVNTKVSAPGDRQSTDLDFGMTFFPEGGGRINGVSQKIAFKAEGSNGLPVEIDGVVKDASNRKVAELHSLHDGMGTFVLPASIGSAILFAEVRVRNYADKYGMPFGRTFPLPQVSTQPCALAIDRISEDSLRWHILGDKSEGLHLILHSGSRVIAEEEVTEKEGLLSLKDCRDGISHLVLATRDGIGLSRRLIFKNNMENVITGDIRLQEGDPSEARNLTTWRLELKDQKGRPMRGDFSVSVLDAGLVNCDYDSLRDNIVSNLLLTGDLRGYVHNAGWYFEDSVSQTRRDAALDLLMLSHGWCRFSTDTLKVKDQEFPHPLEEKEWLSGKVAELSWKDKDKTIPITVMDTAGNSYGMGQLDSLGNFFIGDLNYPDDARLHVRILSRGKRPKFIFDKPTFPSTTHKEPFRQDFKSYVEDTLTLRRFYIDSKGLRTRTLQNVEVTASRSEGRGKLIYHDVKDYHYINDNYDLYVYDRGIDVVNKMIDNDWYKYFDPIEAFPEINYGWENIKPSTRKPSVNVIDGEGKSRGGSLRTLELVHSVDIDSIVCRVTSRGKSGENYKHNPNGGGEFVRKKNYDSYGRVIYVYLKRGVKINDLVRDRRRTAHYTFGYTPPADFYNPIYATAEDRAWPVPDLRKTLRWIPSLQSDENGEALFQYYNSDHPGSRFFTIEGVTFSGKPFRIVRWYKQK